MNIILPGGMAQTTGNLSGASRAIRLYEAVSTLYQLCRYAMRRSCSPGQVGSSIFNTLRAPLRIAWRLILIRKRLLYLDDIPCSQQLTGFDCHNVTSFVTIFGPSRHTGA